MTVRASPLHRHLSHVKDKWTTYDGTFSSFVDANDRQQDRIELRSQRNAQDATEKTIELSGLQSLTSMHGNTGKDEPRDIIILKISGKKHRLGFDNIYDYNQWKTLLDGVYNAAWDMTGVSHANNESTVNMLYDSVNGMHKLPIVYIYRRIGGFVSAQRHRVRFADVETQEILALPTDACELVVDPDKLVLEQHHERQYTFPRSAVRTLRLVDDSTVEYELGGRAPVQGFVRFRFETPADARACLSCWKEGTIPKDVLQQAQVTVRQTSYRLEREHLAGKHPEDQGYRAGLSSRCGTFDALRPARAVRQSFDATAAVGVEKAGHEYVVHRTDDGVCERVVRVLDRPLYQIDEPLTVIKTNVPSNDYATFQTLV